MVDESYRRVLYFQPFVEDFLLLAVGACLEMEEMEFNSFHIFFRGLRRISAEINQRYSEKYKRNYQISFKRLSPKPCKKIVFFPHIFIFEALSRLSS